MRKYLLTPAVVVLAALAVPSYAAITLKIDGFRVGNVTGTGPANSSSNAALSRTMQWRVNELNGFPQVGGGVFNLDISGQFGGTIDFGTGNGAQSFAAYCVELDQGFNPFPTNPLTYTAESALAYFGSSTVANNLGKLYSQGIVFDTAEKTAAFQIAVWEVIHEKSGTFAVGNSVAGLAGNADFTTYTGSTASAATFTQAQTYLDAIAGATNNVTLTVYKNDNFQDLIVAVPVPEPTTAAMLLAGLAGIGYFGVMRTRRSH